MVLLVCCAGVTTLASSKYYDWFRSPEAEERQRQRKLKRTSSLSVVSSGRASVASSRLSLLSVGSGSRVPLDVEHQRLLPRKIHYLPSHRQSKQERTLLDVKGGQHGHYSKARNKVDKISRESGFEDKVCELNKDPTGHGKTWTEVVDNLKREQDEEVTEEAFNQANLVLPGFNNRKYRRRTV